MGRDKRREPRIDFHLPISIKGHTGVYSIRNFSLVGVFIKTPTPSEFKVGEEIEVIARLPNEKRPIHAKAKVAHVKRNGIGIEFVDILPQDAMALKFCFHVFKHTIPYPGAE
ncbi:MAG: PilZ domain-containing protein [Deltaproteobacteria bacterium]|nr:PilZ domain-containing protein [Deltaproteobacteria bacterium]RLB90498.1 MAG: hypothetical protein DRH10_03900 [Deltaproteobacteria bacterium]RLB95196.1 MAG: hypothetical protein DRH50_04860 [Deltaproteobacteria bacterium]RLC10002.1 MAG: hypothetical protein DRH43_07255 [Deltaproteobacteria bacterium]